VFAGAPEAVHPTTPAVAPDARVGTDSVSTRVT
jgi:hypothetical protein